MMMSLYFDLTAGHLLQVLLCLGTLKVTLKKSKNKNSQAHNLTCNIKLCLHKDSFK